MALNPYSRPAEQKILPYNTDLIAGLAEYNQKRYDTASGEYDELLGAFNKIPALEQDIPKRQEAIDQYRKALSDAHSKAQGDYAKMLPVLKRLKNDFQNDRAYGKLGAIEAQYNAAAAYNKEVDDRLTKGEIDARTADLLKQDANLRYKNIGEPDQFGRYSGKYQGRTPAAIVKLYDEGDKLAKGWEAQKSASEGVTFKTDAEGRRYMVNSKGETEYVNGKEVQQYIKQALENNPNARAYADQQTWVDNYGITMDSEIYGSDQHGNQVQIDPEAYVKNYRNKITDDPANFMGAKYGYDRTSTGTGIKEDSYGLEDYKNKNEINIPMETISGQILKNKVTANLSLEDMMKNIEYNPDGSIKEKIVSLPKTAEDIAKEPKNMNPKTGTLYATDPNKKVDVKNEVEIYYKELQNKYPEIKNLTPKDGLKLVADATKSLESQTGGIIKLDKKINESLQYSLFGTDGYGDLANRRLFSIDAQGNKSEDNYQAVAKALGYGDNIPQTALKQAQVIGVDKSGTNTGSYVVSLPDAEGNPTNLYVAASEQLQKIAALPQEVNQLIISGGGESQNFPGLKVELKLNNKTRSFEPVIHYGDKEYNMQQFNTITNETVKQYYYGNK